MIQAMRAEALLVWNLTDQKYVELVLDGNLANLPAAIAAHWPAAQADSPAATNVPPTEYPIPTTKKQIRDPSLLKTIKTIAKNLINLMKRTGSCGLRVCSKSPGLGCNRRRVGVPLITGVTLDFPTGALVQRIDDVNTALVSARPGWVTPASGGLHVNTDFEFDA